MRKRLDEFGEVSIFDKMDDFGLDCIEKTERRYGSSTLEKDE